MNGKRDSARPFFDTVARCSLSFLALLAAASCVDDTGGNVPPDGSTFAYGTLRVSLRGEFPPYWGNSTDVSAQFHDGPTIDPLAWREQASSGSCRLLVPETPFCDPGCGSSGVCSVEGVCTAFPNPVNAGRLTVKGVNTAAGANSFVMSPAPHVYQSTDIEFGFPPYAEGDLLTLTAAGSADVPAFSVSGRGPHLPQVLNDSIVLDGAPILLRWTPPGPGAGPSTVVASLEISHHGGIKGMIECVSEDVGEVEIAGSLVNELKALGISGYPQLDVIRRTTTTVEGQGIRLIVEARILKYVTIPGLTSCREDEECPQGQACQDDFKCQ